MTAPPKLHPVDEDWTEASARIGVNVDTLAGRARAVWRARDGMYRLALLMISLVLALVAKAPTLTNHIIFIDEPIYLDQAMLVNTPERFVYAFLYRAETKFPLGLVPYLLAEWIDWQHALLILHVFGLVAVVASIYLMLIFSNRAYGSVVPGLVACVAWCLYLTRYTITAAVLLEYFQIPLLLGGAVILVHGRKDGRWNLLAVCGTGLLVGLAALVKPPAILLAGPIVLLLLVTAGTWRERLQSLIVACTAAAMPIGVSVAPYLFRPDALAALRLGLLDLPRWYSSDGRVGPLGKVFDMLRGAGLPFVGWIALATVAFAAARVVRRAEGHWPRTAVIDAFLLLTAVMLFLGYSVGQYKQHYLIPILPFAFLFACHALPEGFRGVRSARSRLTSAAFVWLVLLLALSVSIPTYGALLTDHGQRYAADFNVDVTALSRYIKTHSAATDTIWVYYNAPEVYWLADRRSATDDPPASWLIDLYDPFWFNHVYNQLAANRPAIIVGFDQPRAPRPWAGALLEIPRVGDLVRARYDCSAGLIAHTTVCRLKAAPS